MAQRSSVIKAQLQIADLDRHHYQDYNLTLAQYPSETQRRLLVRLLAFAANASEQLVFSSNLSDEGQPELSEKSLQGDYLLWIAFGQPDPKWLRKACQQSARVRLYAYGGRALPLWLQQQAKELKRLTNLEIFEITEKDLDAVEPFYERNLRLQCTLSDGQLGLTNGLLSAEVELKPVAFN